jgi:APA family basic amino acid/polyamine antiporter
MDPGVTAALAIGLAPYLVAVWPAAAGHERWVSLATVWALALLNMSGLRLSSRTLNLLTAFKVLALLAVVAGAFTIGTGSWSHFSPWLTRRPASPPLGQALGLGLIGAFYSFGGFWEASRVAGEIREPRRTLPRALVTGVAAVTALYALTTLAFAYLVPPEHTVDARDFARRVGQGLLGPAGPGVLAAVVVVSASASILALLLMAPRLYVAMSRDGLFPAALAALSPRTDSPARATALLAALASLLVLTGSFSQVVALFMCTTLVFIGLAAAGLFVVRRRAAGITAFLAPGYPVTPAIFVLLVFVVIGLIALARPIPALAGFVLMLIGVPVYAVLTRRARAGPVSLGGAR